MVSPTFRFRGGPHHRQGLSPICRLLVELPSRPSFVRASPGKAIWLRNAGTGCLPCLEDDARVELARGLIPYQLSRLAH